MCETIGSICLTCLSTNRNLLPIKEHKSAIENWTKINVIDDCKICWECTAMFRRIENFKAQVLNASMLFNKFFQQKIMKFTTLSRLTYITNDTFDNIYHDTIGGNIKCEWNEIEESPNNSNDGVYSDVVKDEHIDIDDTFSAIVKVERDYDNNSVTDNVVQDYNEMSAVANHFCSDVNISNPFATLPGESIDCVVPENMDRSKIKKELNLLEVEVPNLNETICDSKIVPIKKTQVSNEKCPIEKTQEVKEETMTKKKNVKVCDRYKMVAISEEEMLNERQKERERDIYVKSAYKCENCILGYTTKAQYLNHRTNLHSETLQIKCPICECTFANEISLDVHESSHYRIYQCSECTYMRIRIDRVLAHYQKDHLKQEFYTCSKCQMKFGTKSKLIHHRSKAHKPLATCFTCGKEFNKLCLKKHMLQHTGMPQYHCGICDKYYRGKSGLAAHMRNTHNKSETICCEQCDAKFKAIDTYKIHLRAVHSSERLDKVPKTSAERGQEFRARKVMLKQQKEPDAVVETATEDIQSADPSEDNEVPGPSEIRAIEKRARHAEATRRWREKKRDVSESSKKCMREHRERKKFKQTYGE